MRRRITTAMTLGATFIVLSALTACGKSNVGSPISPSLPTEPPASGATIRGQVNRGNLTVSITGTGVSSGVDDSGRFELNGAPAGNLELQFVGQGVTARVGIGRVNNRDRVELQITLFGNTGSVDAREYVTPDGQAEVEGAISSINSAARSMQVGGANLQVPSDARIVSDTLSLTFDDLKVGMRVQAEGTMQGNVIVAQQVKVEDGVQVESPEQEIEFSGTISALAGACPALTMTIAGKNVATASATKFVNATCGDLKNGVLVEVKGSVISGGRVSASEIRLDDNGDGGSGNGGSGGGGDNGGGSSGGSSGGNLVTVEGFVPGFVAPTGTCPNIKFGVESTNGIDTFVFADSSTEYKGGTCADVKLGVLLEVKGDRQADKSLHAVEVKFTSK